MDLRISKVTLRRASRWLAGFPSLGYALAYLICIPLFATIYYFLPYHFYHSTIQYEQVLDRDADDILKRIRSEIIKTFKEKNGSEFLVSDGWTLNINDLTVKSLKITGDWVSFSTDIKLIKNQQKIFSADGESSIEIADINEQKAEVLFYIGNSSESNYDGAETIFFRSSDTTNLPSSEIIRLHLLFPCKFKSCREETFLGGTVLSGPEAFTLPQDVDAPASEHAFMPIPSSLHEQILGYAKGVSGFPSKTTGSYWRMLYLSAVTISTLGYGDILPITTVSRILLSTEAIIGIVLVGLFLNSLAYESNFKDNNLSKLKEEEKSQTTKSIKEKQSGS